MAAARGFRVFPGKKRSKTPALPWAKFQREAPTDEELRRWDESRYNMCIITGEPSGVFVLDVDSPEAEQLVDSLHLPETPTVRTPKGRHLYFKVPPFEVRNSVNLEGVKLDVRGNGGYVMAAGSLHPSGAHYEWIVSPEDTGFADFPSEHYDLIRNTKTDVQFRGDPRAEISSTTGTGGLDRYLTSRLEDAKVKIAAAVEGERNNTLFKIAVRLARDVAALDMAWEPFAASLAASAEQIGLAASESLKCLDSAWQRGSAEPTPWIRVAWDHVYLSFQERFYHLPSRTDLKPSGFNGQYGHLFWEKGSFAHHLLRSDLVKKVHDLTYEPLCGDRFIECDGRTHLNTFRPSTITSTEGDPAPFVDFLTGLVPDEAERQHLLKMMAFTVRNPGRKLRYALLLRTAVQGVGKSMLTDIWGRLLGSQNVRKTTSKELSSDYQGYLPETLLVVCEELNLGMGAKAYNDLKDMITGDTALVNEKHLRQRQWPLFATFVFLSNLKVPILIEETDRRIFYVDSSAQRREPAYYKAFADWWSANLGVIRGFLDSVDLSTFNQFEAPPSTASKTALIEGSRSELAQELTLAIQSRQGCFDRDIVTLDQVLLEMGPVLQRRSKTPLQKALKEIGAVPLGQQRVGGVPRASIWAIRNARFWCLTDGPTRAEELSRSTGMFSGLDELGIEVGHICELGGTDLPMV